MIIGDLVHRIEAFNRARGWDLVSPSIAIVHLMEELGELGHHIQNYTASEICGTDNRSRDAIGTEICDLLVVLVNIASMWGVDLTSLFQSRLMEHACLQKKVLPKQRESVHQLTVGSIQTQIRQKREGEDKYEPPEMVLLSTLNALGELARHVIFREGLKCPDNRTNPSQQFGDQVVDAWLSLTELASCYAVELEQIIPARLTRLEARFLQSDGLRDTASYLARQTQDIQRAVDWFRARFSDTVPPDPLEGEKPA